jgi:hypothetical protein
VRSQLACSYLGSEIRGVQHHANARFQSKCPRCGAIHSPQVPLCHSSHCTCLGTPSSYKADVEYHPFITVYLDYPLPTMVQVSAAYAATTTLFSAAFLVIVFVASAVYVSSALRAKLYRMAVKGAWLASLLACPIVLTKL